MGDQIPVGVGGAGGGAGGAGGNTFSSDLNGMLSRVQDSLNQQVALTEGLNNAKRQAQMQIAALQMEDGVISAIKQLATQQSQAIARG